MFLRGRSLMFWLVLLVFLYLAVSSPQELADFTRDVLGKVIDFLHGIREYFIDVRA
ncbi:MULTISPECIES: hypothetical protein [unclassified Streptomyces]|uniref:hypothetical protein n=1 Tax=unclassified Streptomyces TaxID=2593676 RepID=UPI0033226D69